MAMEIKVTEKRIAYNGDGSKTYEAKLEWGAGKDAGFKCTVRLSRDAKNFVSEDSQAIFALGFDDIGRLVTHAESLLDSMVEPAVEPV